MSKAAAPGLIIVIIIVTGPVVIATVVVRVCGRVCVCSFVYLCFPIVSSMLTN